MKYPFVTFSNLEGTSVYTSCLKYIILEQIILENRGGYSVDKMDQKTYFVYLDNNQIRVSKETYSEIMGIVIESNRKFDRLEG